MQERKKGVTQRVAAARAGIGERTARKYERAAALPSQLKRSHDWRTRPNPFEGDWEWVVSQLERDPALQGSTLFSHLCRLIRSEEHTSELQSLAYLVCRLLLEKKKKKIGTNIICYTLS